MNLCSRNSTVHFRGRPGAAGDRPAIRSCRPVGSVTLSSHCHRLAQLEKPMAPGLRPSFRGSDWIEACLNMTLAISARHIGCTGYSLHPRPCPVQAQILFLRREERRAPAEGTQGPADFRKPARKRVVSLLKPLRSSDCLGVGGTRVPDPMATSSA